MKVSQLLLFGIFLSGISYTTAQDKKSLTLDEAINMAWLKSNEVSLANSKVDTKKYELQAVKNERYPDVKVSGQYQHLTKATINLKLNNTSASSEPSPVVNQLLLGQANATLPVFAGFKIQNSIIALDNMYQAETANAMQTKEEVAMQVVNYYARLYKAQKTVELLKENQKSTLQRAVDFTALEKNGIIPRNDLLKAQLQVSKLQLSLDRANSDLNNVNYELVSLLKLDPKINLIIRESDFADFQMINIPTNESIALESRKDLEAVRLQEKASLANIKVAKSAYYPQVAIIGGYTSLGLKNVVTVQNAINIGVGFSYDLSGILKNGTNVKIAESKALEVQNSENLLTDYIKIQVQKAIEDYDLAIKQDLVYNEAVDQASENYRIIKEKYDNGLSDTNDLLDADVEQLGSKINKALAKANVIQKYYELLSVSGQLNQTFNLSKI
ncbi:TolC family protein [Flavobacterium sp. F-380]|uniref:TolC family protein n=1 Tax=Flavobacterium kayseriense TaxID=2764714 RepID=A0ABR7J6B8_9FLAO|nr:TolC family protein [Flavobacterium kayseriense]MBC5841076.1 TolC family protein [Flavobacterium kayseriense]MBC5847604.1 TolC family protein [Flavobacterium kayseriense]